MDKDELVRDLDLLRRVISQDVEFGAGDLAGCPFHEDKTPSLHIFASKSGRARYHCFGCGAEGDIFNYVMNKRKVKFILAQLWLSKFIGETITSVTGLVTSPSSLPESQSGRDFCFNSCENYANLKEDYETLLRENEELRERLNLPEFSPSTESKVMVTITVEEIRRCRYAVDNLVQLSPSLSDKDKIALKHNLDILSTFVSSSVGEILRLRAART